MEFVDENKYLLVLHEVWNYKCSNQEKSDSPESEEESSPSHPMHVPAGTTDSDLSFTCKIRSLFKFNNNHISLFFSNLVQSV